MADDETPGDGETSSGPENAGLGRAEYLCLVWHAGGLSNSEIGARMGVSSHVVAVVLKMLAKKLEVSDSAGLIARALELGLIDKLDLKPTDPT